MDSTISKNPAPATGEFAGEDAWDDTSPPSVARGLANPDTYGTSRVTSATTIGTGHAPAPEHVPSEKYIGSARTPSETYVGTDHLSPDPYIEPGYAGTDAYEASRLGAEHEHPSIDRAAHVAHETVDKAAHAAAPAADWLSEKSAGARVKQKQWVADARVYISANPMKGAGIAAAVGLLIGLII